MCFTNIFNNLVFWMWMCFKKSAWVGLNQIKKQHARCESKDSLPVLYHHKFTASIILSQFYYLYYTITNSLPVLYCHNFITCITPSQLHCHHHTITTVKIKLHFHAVMEIVYGILARFIVIHLWAILWIMGENSWVRSLPTKLTVA